MPEGVPLQSHSRLPAGRPFGGRRRLPRFTDPSTTSLARAPYAADRPGLPRFRPRGFSPPRRLPGSIELAALFRAAAVPGLSSPFRAFPSRQVACPSSGPLAPLPFVPVEPRCGVRGLVTFDLHRLGRRSGVVPGRILSGLEAPFQRSLLAFPYHLAAAREHASRRLPVTLDLVRRTHLGPAVPSTSKRSSLRESVHTAPRSTFRLLVARRPVLSWASSPLQSLAPAKPGALTSPATAGGVPPPAGTARLSARRATSRTSPLPCMPLACATSAAEQKTLDVGWVRAWTTESSRSTRRRTPDPYDPGRAALRQQPRLP
jgi:hypothetical protein